MVLDIYNNDGLISQIKKLYLFDEDIKIFDFNYKLYKNFKEEFFLIDFDVYNFVGIRRKNY